MTPLAVSLGDPAGIGPETILRAWLEREAAGLRPFFVVGGSQILEAAADRCGLDCATGSIGSPSEAPDSFQSCLPVLETADGAYSPGTPSDEGAALALHSLAEATRLVLLGQSSAMVTAPVAKAQLARVGFEYPGQTEFLAASCGLDAEDAVMMLAGPQLRAIPLTVHCALADVPKLVTSELIIRRTTITAKALHRDFGIAEPRIAVAALNPHAGEDGKFGREDQEVVAPAIAELQSRGLDVTGPHPADALFAPHKRASFDVAVCMYHDQALIPVKALDFDSGVNVTLGLPIIRSSPDHGTAFDIAGKGIADPGAMIAAIRMAGECAAQRADG